MNHFLIYSLIGLIILSIFYWFSTKGSLEKPKNNIKETMTSETVKTSENKENIKNDETENKESKLKVKVINFNTSWCKFSVMFASEWAKFETMVENMEDVEALDIKCDDSANSDMCSNYSIPGFPFVIFEYNDSLEEYNGERSAEALMNKVKEIVNKIK